MNRTDLQNLSDTRIREAKILFAAEEYSGAYYLAGYAVECALKACFARGVKQYDFPEKGRADKIFTHNLKELARHAYLSAELDTEMLANPSLSACWNEVAAWSEASRYSVRTKDQAESLLDAILREKDGALQWIRQRW